MLDTLKKLKFEKLIIKDCRTNTDKTCNMSETIFDDNITKDINNNFIIDTIQKKATKKIKKELESMDKDLCYHEFEITKINNENLKYYKQDDILRDLAQYSDKEQINITIQIKTHYEITVEYAFGCPPNTATRKHVNGVISHEDNFGFGVYLPIKEVIQFTNKNITAHEIEKLIFSKCRYDSADKSKYSFSVFDPHFKYPKEKEYVVGIELPEDSDYLRNVKLNINIPQKTNQTMHKLSGEYIIHCTGDYDKKEVLKEFEKQLTKKRNDKHLTSITDNMIQTITQELDKQSQEQDNRLYGLTFDEKSLQKYPDIFKSILNENTQQNNTNNNNSTTPTLNKNKTKKFGNKKPKYCCCCCNKCC